MSLIRNARDRIWSDEAITPSDDDELDYDGIYIGVGASKNVSILWEGNTSPTVYKNVGDGRFIWGAIKKVYDTDTTCTDIIGIYLYK